MTTNIAAQEAPRKRIYSLDAQGQEVPHGSPDTVSVRVEGMEHFPNSTYRIGFTDHHPNPQAQADWIAAKVIRLLEPEAFARRTDEIPEVQISNAAAPSCGPPKTVDHAKPFSTEDADRLRTLPALADLRKAKRWVLWRWEPKPGQDGKYDKILYRSDRPDVCAKSNDSDSWSDFGLAIDAALHAKKVAGVGIVLTSSKSGLTAFDLDHCRNRETGEIAPWAQKLLDACKGTYVEVTPSLSGLRVIGTGRKEKVRFVKIPQEDGGVLETYRMATRFVTVTGYQIGTFTGLHNLDPVIDYYQAEEAKKHLPRSPKIDTDGTTVVDIERLRAAIAWIPNIERDDWLHVGMGLHTIGERELWDEWSADCDKFNMAGQDKAWRSFHDRSDGININTIFYMAKEKGWDRNEIDVENDPCLEWAPIPESLKENSAGSGSIIEGVNGFCECDCDCDFDMEGY